VLVSPIVRPVSSIPSQIFHHVALTRVTISPIFQQAAVNDLVIALRRYYLVPRSFPRKFTYVVLRGGGYLVPRSFPRKFTYVVLRGGGRRRYSIPRLTYPSLAAPSYSIYFIILSIYALICRPKAKGTLFRLYFIRCLAQYVCETALHSRHTFTSRAPLVNF